MHCTFIPWLPSHWEEGFSPMIALRIHHHSCSLSLTTKSIPVPMTVSSFVCLVYQTHNVSGMAASRSHTHVTETSICPSLSQTHPPCSRPWLKEESHTKCHGGWNQNKEHRQVSRDLEEKSAKGSWDSQTSCAGTLCHRVIAYYLKGPSRTCRPIIHTFLGHWPFPNTREPADWLRFGKCGSLDHQTTHSSRWGI